MKSNISIFLLAVMAALFSAGSVNAQFYVTGESPARIKWNYIKSENYKIIYPQEIDSLAQRYMYLFEAERERTMAGMKVNPKPIPIVLHPYTTMSNGTVVWAPKRVELYTVPTACGSYAQNWEKQLVLHEGRHIGQMTHFTKGIYKPLGWLFGEQITGLGVGVYASKWLLEGDAVVAETELSESGRGRSADFLEYYRASFLSGEFRNWDKWRYGSFKSYYPDYYALGYMLNSTMRVKSGNYLAAGDLLDGYVKRFYNPDVQTEFLKKVAGANRKELFNESVQMYTDMWRKEYEQRGEFTNPVGMPHRESKYYFEYSNPIEFGRDSMVYIKYSNDKASELVLLSSSEEFLREHKSGEKRLRIIGESAVWLEAKDKTLYWVESIQDARWGNEVFNILYSYNVETGVCRKMSDKTSYNNPVLSWCEDYLSVIEYPFTGGSNLVVLDAETGEKVYSVPAPCNGQLTECTWIDETVYALAITDKGLGLFVMDMANLYDDSAPRGEWKRVINEQSKSICSMSTDGTWLYFESDMDGVNNIYFFNPKTEELQRRTNARFAAREPNLTSDGRLHYIDLQLDGKHPVYVEDSVVYKGANEPYVCNKEIMNGYEFTVAETLSRQADDYFAKNLADSKESVPAARYESKRYRKGTHLFRFHSWAPVYYNVENIMELSYDHFYELVSLGATAYSQNTLGTAVSMLGYSYRDGYHAAHASFEYSGLYPVFKLSGSYNTDDRLKYRVYRENDQTNLEIVPTGKPLFELSALAYVPINLSSKGWERGLVPQIQWNYENNAFYSAKENDYFNRQQVTYALRYYQMHPVAEAAIFPKWGFGAEVSGAFSPNGKENFGSIMGGYGYLYMPGIFNCQGLRLSFGYQKHSVENKWMYLDNLLEMPRGYEDYFGEEYYKFSADYAIPVNFRGISLGWLAYLKRLQIIPFVDIAQVRTLDKAVNLNSYGCDLLLDAYVFRIGTPVSFGVRYARINDNGERNHIGFLASISMF